MTVDVEAVLLYYKTKLACHNYTVYDLSSHRVTCYFWHEGEAGLDADTFASCLVDYLANDARCQSASQIIVYSDGCTSQNRNAVFQHIRENCSSKVSGKRPYTNGA